jgi:hypothetical protein
VLRNHIRDPSRASRRAVRRHGVASCAGGCKSLEGGPAAVRSDGSGRGGEAQEEGAMEDLDALECRVGQSRVVLENEGKGNSIFRVP